MKLLSCLVAIALAGASGAGGSGLARGAAAPCSRPVVVPEQSFQRLATPDRRTYVWVDEVSATFLGSFRPFDLYVLAGQAVAPFQAESGRLDRASFERIARAGYNVARFGPFRVEPGALPGKTAFPFTSAGRHFELKALSVNTRNQSVELQVCGG